MKYRCFITVLVFALSLITVQAKDNQDTVYLAVNEADQPKLSADGGIVASPAGVVQSAEIEQAEPVVQEPIKAYIDYNIINQNKPLLSKYTKKEFDHGFIKTFEPSVAYQGNFNFKFTENEREDTRYEDPLLDVTLKGKLRAPFEYKFQYNMYSKGHINYFKTFFKDQYIAYTGIPHHKIYLGYYKPAVGKEGSGSNLTKPLLNRSQLAKKYGAARAMGTKIEGSYDLVDYSLGVTSSDRKFDEFFPGLEFTGWLDLKPLGKTKGQWGELTLGGGLNAGRRHDDYVVASTAASYKYKKFGLFAEYAAADGSNGSKGFTTDKSQGACITATYNITKKLQLVGRYDVFDSNRNKPKKTVTEYTAGLTYFVKGSSLKFLLNYVYRQQESGPESHRILVGTQIIL